MYTLDTTKLFKIWFSKNPDSFLRIENQLRFIRLREKNPEAKISFIYSAECLSTQSKSELKNFCSKYNITPVDFDSHVHPLLSHQQDISLYATATQEIKRAFNNTGGNMAAASDCVRIIIPILEQYGIYSDFDVDVKLRDAPKQLNIKAPLLFPAEITETQTIIIDSLALSLETPSLNCEFIAASTVTGTSKLHDDAVKKLHLLQSEMLSRYNNPKEALLTGPIEASLLPTIPHKAEPLCTMIIEKYFDKNKTSNIFDFRRYLQSLDTKEVLKVLPPEISNLIFGENGLTNLPVDKIKEKHGMYIKEHLRNLGMEPTSAPQELSEKVVKTIKHLLETNSVMCVSGPIVYLSLWKQDYNKDPIIQDRIIPGHGTKQVVILSKWYKFLDTVLQSGLKENNFKQYVYSRNTIEEMTAVQKKATEEGENIDSLIGECGDQSWTDQGYLALETRENHMIFTATKLQRLWREKHPRKSLEAVGNTLKATTAIDTSCKKEEPTINSGPEYQNPKENRKRMTSAVRAEKEAESFLENFNPIDRSRSKRACIK